MYDYAVLNICDTVDYVMELANQAHTMALPGRTFNHVIF